MATGDLHIERKGWTSAGKQHFLRVHPQHRSTVFSVEFGDIEQPAPLVAEGWLKVLPGEASGMLKPEGFDLSRFIPGVKGTARGVRCWHVMGDKYATVEFVGVGPVTRTRRKATRRRITAR